MVTKSISEITAHFFSKRALFWIFSISGFFISLFLRRPEFLKDPQLWAEDGIFLSQAFNLGIKSLIFSHAGYQHLYIRLVAYLTDISPIALIHYPKVYLAFWVMALLLVVYFVFKLSKLTCSQRMLLVLLIPMGPVANEPFFFLCATPVILGLLFPLLISDPLHKSRTGKIFSLVLFGLISLSGPYIIMLFPIILTISLRRLLLNEQRKYYKSLLMIASICFVVQTLTIKSRIPLESRLFSLEALRPIGLTFSNLFSGHLAYQLKPMEWSVAALIGLAVYVYLFVDSFKKKNHFVYTNFYYAFIVLTATTIVCREDPSAINPWFAGVRYFFIPTITSIWGIAAYLWSSERKILRRLGYCFCILQMSIFMVDFPYFERVTRVESYTWSEEVKHIDPKSSQVNIPINPMNWYVHLNRPLLGEKTLY